MRDQMRNMERTGTVDLLDYVFLALFFFRV